MKDRFAKGYLLAVMAAILWGVSGTFGQYLFQTRQLNTEWLVTVRLLISGLVLLTVSAVKSGNRIFHIWRNKRDAIQLLIFSIAGLVAVQYTFFEAIRCSNAATATVLQYIAPVLITCYVSLRKAKLPALKEAIAVVLALLGTFFLVTHGSIKTLSISGPALFWGITTAFTLAFYTLQPQQLLKKYEAATVIGWGMFTGGLAFSFVHLPWLLTGVFDTTTVVFVSFIILGGGLAAFYAYLISVKYIGPVKTSLLACVEPLSAALIGVLWLRTPFGWFDWAGTLLIVTAVILLTLSKKTAAG